MADGRLLLTLPFRQKPQQALLHLLWRLGLFALALLRAQVMAQDALPASSPPHPMTQAHSADGAWSVDGASEPGNLLVIDAQQRVVRRYPMVTLDGKRATQFAHVHHAAPRQSFIIALHDLPELWELSYDAHAEPLYDGYVHDYKMGEGIAKPGFLGIRRTPLDVALSGLVFDADFRHALGVAPLPQGPGVEIQVINLDIRRRIDRVPLALPSPTTGGTGACVPWTWRQTTGLYCATAPRNAPGAAHQ